MEKSQQSILCIEAENIQLKETLLATETKLSNLELQKIAIEGELHRVHVIIKDKDDSNFILQEENKKQHKCVLSLEECCENMKLTIEQLRMKIKQTASTESELNAEIKNLQIIRTNQEKNLYSGNEKIQELQKLLTNSENERRIITEKLNSCQQSLTDTKQVQQNTCNQLNKVQEYLHNLEIQKMALESKLKMINWRDNYSNSSNINQGI